MKKNLILLLMLSALLWVGCGKEAAVVSEAYDYDGALKGKLAHGQGQLFENGQLIYEGSFKDGIIDGEGKLYENGELVYEGAFVEAMALGKGTFYRRGVVYFSGEVVENSGSVMSMEGLLHTEEGIPYFQGGLTMEGDILSLKSPGVLLYPEGEKMYEGPFVDNAPTDDGTYFSLDGEIIEKPKP